MPGKSFSLMVLPLQAPVDASHLSHLVQLLPQLADEANRLIEQNAALLIEFFEENGGDLKDAYISLGGLLAEALRKTAASVGNGSAALV